MGANFNTFVPFEEVTLTISDEEYNQLLGLWETTDHDNDPARDENGEVIDHRKQVLEGLQILAELDLER